MPNFAIMRCKKLTGMGSVAAALQHCYRDRETPNADHTRTPDNEHLVSTSSDQAMGALRDRLPEKRRKDAVLAVEYVMTASPTWWAQAGKMDEARFVRQSMAWLGAKYGLENIVAATVHHDELTPHISAFVVPITSDGRLSAKEFIGNKAKMTQDQTRFAQAVSELGLERGIEGSRATHQRVRTFYADLEREAIMPAFTEDELKPQKVKGDTLVQKVFGAVEPPYGVIERLNEKISRAVGPALASAAAARLERRRADEMQKTALAKDKELKAVQDRIERVERLFKGLTKVQTEQVYAMLMGFKQENQREIDNQARKEAQIRSAHTTTPPRDRNGPSR